MTRFLVTISILVACSGCAHTGDNGGEDAQYHRVEYFETVFRPASEAYRKAGGFMIFEDPNETAGRYPTMSYSDMRLAIARGCGGI
jgi:hypothetical protein